MNPARFLSLSFRSSVRYSRFGLGKRCLRLRTSSPSYLHNVQKATFSSKCTLHRPTTVTKFQFSSKEIDSYLIRGISVLNGQNCSLNTRCYHDDSGGRDDNDNKPPRVKGVVVVLPNPLDWFKNKWHMWKIKQMDPNFSLNEFMHGALQAVTVVTQYVSQQDFDALKGLLTDRVIVDLKDKLHYEEGKDFTSVSIVEEDIVYRKAKTWKVVEDEASKKLKVDTYFVALKYNSEQGETYMMEIGFNFSRDYNESGPGDWIIDHVSRFRVREFQGGKPRNQD